MPVVSTHAHIGLLYYYSCIYQVSMQANKTCKICGKTCARANQNARVYFVQTKDACMLFVKTMMHMAAD